MSSFARVRPDSAVPDAPEATESAHRVEGGSSVCVDIVVGGQGW